MDSSNSGLEVGVVRSSTRRSGNSLINGNRSRCSSSTSRSIRSRSYNVDDLVVEVVYINVLLGVV